MRRSSLLIAFILVAIVFPRPAWAYLDPGAGSYLLQIAIGLFLGGLWGLKMGWRRFRDAVSNRFARRQ